MFTDTVNASWDERSRRGLTTLTSLGVQALAVGVLLLLPLLRPTGLPSLRPLATPVSLGQPIEQAPAVRTQLSGNTAAPSDPAAIPFRMPTRIPNGIPAPGDDAPPTIGQSGPYIPGAPGQGSPDGVLNSFGTTLRPVMPATPAAAPPVRISHMDEGDLVRKTLPVYPPLARMARIQGQVVLQAVISKQGAIENLKVLAGHPMLVQAAMDAVRQWRYRPYVLNHEPVEVETQITVNFSLAGN
jgi:protein TonB